VLEKPAAVVERYGGRTPAAPSLSVTSPPDQSPASGIVTVAGTTAPGAAVDVAAVADDPAASSIASVTADGAGAFSFEVPVGAGVTVLVVAATAPDGGTAQVVRTVVNDVVEGTLLLAVDDPDGDDAGPGNYAYPTSPDFHPGAFDLERFEIYDTGSTVTFRVRTRDLSPTFGSPLGAQLVDVYVHRPGDAATAASFPQRNYTIAPTFGWGRLIEVQGFGQRFVDSSSSTVGAVALSANAVSRYITFSVSKAALGGTPATGWAFTVTLTGQDGFSADQARGFAATPQAFTFGVCATASTDPRCAADPAAVPKVMDTIDPPGVSQAAELDYTLGPVVLQGVALP
jgi:carbohydrate-binding DOMON domain-containing protein